MNNNLSVNLLNERKLPTWRSARLYYWIGLWSYCKVSLVFLHWATVHLLSDIGRFSPSPFNQQYSDRLSLINMFGLLCSQELPAHTLTPLFETVATIITRHVRGFLCMKSKNTLNFQMTKKNYLPILSQKNISYNNRQERKHKTGKTLSGFSIAAFPNSWVGLILQTLASNSFFVLQLRHWHAILKRYRRRNVPQVLSKSHQRSQRWVKRWRGGPIHSTTKISNPPRPQLW